MVEKYAINIHRKLEIYPLPYATGVFTCYTDGEFLNVCAKSPIVVDAYGKVKVVSPIPEGSTRSFDSFQKASNALAREYAVDQVGEVKKIIATKSEVTDDYYEADYEIERE